MFLNTMKYYFSDHKIRFWGHSVFIDVEFRKTMEVSRMLLLRTGFADLLGDFGGWFLADGDHVGRRSYNSSVDKPCSSMFSSCIDEYLACVAKDGHSGFVTHPFCSKHVNFINEQYISKILNRKESYNDVCGVLSRCRSQ